MARTRRPFIKLECEECSRGNYYIPKPKGKTVEIDDLELSKFCKQCREHTEHQAKLR